MLIRTRSVEEEACVYFYFSALKACSNSQLSLSFDRQLSSTLMPSHQLWAGSNFDESQWEVWLVWPVMRVAWESMRIIIKGSTKWPMFLSVCLTLRENKKQAMSKLLPIIIIIITIVIIIIISNNQRLVKCVRFQSKNKEIEKRKKTPVNSHATLTARLTDQWQSRTLILVWSRL